jgi:hypothetical protein
MASAATLVAGAIAVRKAAMHRRGAQDDLPVFVALAWLIVTLASPISWEHHYAPAIFVFAVLVQRAESLPGAAIALACVSFPLLAGFIDVRAFTGVVGGLAMSYVMFGGWCLAAALFVSLQSGRPRGPKQNAA